MTKQKSLWAVMLAFMFLFVGFGFAACGGEAKITEISVELSKADSEVAQNSDFDTSKVKIYAKKGNDTLVITDMTNVTFSIDTATVGDTNLVVSYKVDEQTTLSKSIPVVIYGGVESISFKAGSYDADVPVGYPYNANRAILVATYDTGTKADRTIVTREIPVTTQGVEVTSPNVNVLGQSTLTATYKNKTAQATITVSELKCVSIAFDENTVPTEVNKGEILDLTNVKVNGTRQTGDTVVLKSSDYTIEPFSTETAGVRSLVVTLNSDPTRIRATVAIKVYGDVTAIAIKSGTVATSVMAGDVLDTSKIILNLTFEEGLTKEVAVVDLMETEEVYVSEVSTAEPNTTQVLEIRYAGFSTTLNISITGESYTVTNMEQPYSYTTFNERTLNTYNDQLSATGVKGFSYIGEYNETTQKYEHDYYVGSDNPFIYSPTLKVRYRNANPKSKPIELSEYSANIKVEILDDEDFVELDEVGLATYIEEDGIDTFKHSVDFTQEAEDETFRITVTSTADSSASLSRVVKVTSGYNVYNAKELSVLDNVNAGSKWTDFKQTYGIPMDLEINSIVLHNNISIERGDIPSLHFYSDADLVSVDGDSPVLSKTQADYDRVMANGGALKNADIGYSVESGANYEKISELNRNDSSVLGAIYRRAISANSNFTIKGNFFQISVDKIPLCVRDGLRDVATPGEAILGYTALVAAEYAGGQQVLNNNAVFRIEDTNLFGNSNRSQDIAYSGGLMFLKARNVVSQINNTLSQSWYMSFMFRGPDYEAVEYNTSGEADFDYPQVLLNKVNSFDSYNTLLYLQGTGRVEIKDSTLIGAGGPVMIVDHAVVRNEKDNYNRGRPCHIKVYNSNLQSFVEGREAWFISMDASELAGQIKAIDYLVSQVTGGNSDAHGSKTIVKDNKLNLISVFKTDATSGLGDYPSASTLEFVNQSQEGAVNFISKHDMIRRVKIVNGIKNKVAFQAIVDQLATAQSVIDNPEADEAQKAQAQATVALLTPFIMDERVTAIDKALTLLQAQKSQLEALETRTPEQEQLLQVITLRITSLNSARVTVDWVINDMIQAVIDNESTDATVKGMLTQLLAGINQAEEENHLAQIVTQVESLVAGKNILELSNTTIFVPGQDGLDYAEPTDQTQIGAGAMTAQGYISGYLFNNMGIVLGYMDYSA